MATADFTTGLCAPDSPPSADSSEICVVLVKDSFLELMAILSAYSDLLDLMDAGLPEYTFLEMLNARFSRFVFDLPVQRH